MGICPLCNGLQTSSIVCPECRGSLHDFGKAVDYLDNYSAYEEQYILELVDGLSHRDNQTKCLHTFYCYTCLHEFEIAIDTLPDV